MLLGILVANSGCSKPAKPGLLERNGLGDPHDLAFITIRGMPKGTDYRITDASTVSTMYKLINDAKHGPVSEYFRECTVTLVRKNGSTLSFGFGFWNPGLTWHDSSPEFLKFVKTEINGNSKYVNKEHLPVFSVSQVARIVGTTKRVVMPPAKAQKVEPVVQLLASAYVPFSWVTKTTDWRSIAEFCTNSNPGFEAALAKPVSSQTLVGWTGSEPNGSDALRLVSLTVDKMLVFMGEKQVLSLAFHSGKTWFVTSGFSPKDIQGRTPDSVYGDLLGR